MSRSDPEPGAKTRSPPNVGVPGGLDARRADPPDDYALSPRGDDPLPLIKRRVPAAVRKQRLAEATPGRAIGCLSA